MMGLCMLYANQAVPNRAVLRYRVRLKLSFESQMANAEAVEALLCECETRISGQIHRSKRRATHYRTPATDQPRPQDLTPQGNCHIVGRTRAQRREAKDGAGEGGRGGAKKHKKPRKSYRCDALVQWVSTEAI